MGRMGRMERVEKILPRPCSGCYIQDGMLEIWVFEVYVPNKLGSCLQGVVDFIYFACMSRWHT